MQDNDDSRGFDEFYSDTSSGSSYDDDKNKQHGYR